MRVSRSIGIVALLGLAGLGARPTGAQEAPVDKPAQTLQDVVPAEFDTFWIGFLVRPEQVPEVGEADAERLQVEHLAYLRGLARERLSIATGPLEGAPDEPLRGVVVFRGDLTRERVEEVLAADPHVRSGTLRAKVLKWYTAKGSLTWPEASPW